jgi:hypothetical protein
VVPPKEGKEEEWGLSKSGRKRVMLPKRGRNKKRERDESQSKSDL